MKRILFIFLAAVVVFGAATLTVWAASLSQEECSDLVPTNMSWPQEVVYLDDEVTFEITYENQGECKVSDDAEVSFSIVISTTDSPPKVARTVERILTEAAGLEPNLPREVTATLTAPSVAGFYKVVVELDNKDAVREAKENNNTLTKQLVVQSALPPGLAQLFAGLGMFAAVMAIVAVGTEVLIDSLKVLLGLKEKVTALEALDKLERLLPGQLSTLGVDPAAQKIIEGYISELEDTLAPVTGVANACMAVRERRFHDAFQEVAKLAAVQDLAGLADKQFKDYAEEIEARLADALGNLGRDLSLDDDFINGLTTELKRVVQASQEGSILDVLDVATKFLQERAPDLTDEWLKQQADILASQGREAVIALFDQEVKPILEGFGFERNDVAKAKSKLNETLQFLESSFTQGLENLLNAVEKRRNEMQSPLRKLWRRIRRSQEPFLSLLGGLIVGVGLAWLTWILLRFAMPPWLTVLAALVIGVCAALAAWYFMGKLLKLTRLSDRRWNFTLEKLVRGIEKWAWNYPLGRDPNPESYGEPDKVEPVTPTTAAKVVLETEDKHRDEEASRLRWLRVISVFVGIILAYLLQIDAASLLNEAVPGVSGKINATIASGQQLHRLIRMIPEDSHDLTVGIILTGFAAAAGSKFWHDLLGRIQSTRKQAEEAAKFVGQVRGMTGMEE